MGFLGWIAQVREAFWESNAAGYVSFRNAKAIECFEQGSLQMAMLDVRKARQISRRWLGAEDLTALDAMRALVRERCAAGDPEANDLLRRWLTVIVDQITRGLLYPDFLADLDEIQARGLDLSRFASIAQAARLLQQSADSAQAARDFAAAEQLLQAAAALWKRISAGGACRFEWAACLRELSEVIFVRGGYDEAEQLYHLARAGIEDRRRVPPYDLLYVELTNDLSMTALVQGDFDRAEVTIRETEELLQECSGDSSPAERQERLRGLYQKMAQVLIRFLRTLFGFLQDFDRWTAFADDVRHTALEQSFQGLRIGRSLWRRLRGLRKESIESLDPWSAFTPLEKAEIGLLLSKGLLRLNIGDGKALFEEVRTALVRDLDLESAVEELEELLEIDPGNLPDEEKVLSYIRTFDARSPAYTSVLNNLADRAKGPSSQAEAMLREAAAFRASSLGEEHPETCTAHYKLAQFLYETDRGEEAEGFLRRAVAGWRAGNEEGRPLFITGLRTLAALYAATGRETEAWPLLAEAVAIEDEQIASIFSFTSEEQRMALLESLQETYARSLVIAHRAGAASPQVVRESFGLVLRRKGVVGRSQAAQWEAALAGRRSGSHGQELGRVKQKIADLRLSHLFTPSSLAREEELVALNRQREQLERDLAREAAGESLLAELKPVDLEAFSRRLPPGSALIEIVRFDTAFGGVFRLAAGWEDHYLAYVLPDGDLAGLRLVDLGSAGVIDQQIDELRRVIVGERSPRYILLESGEERSTGRAATDRLRESLVAPLLDALQGRTQLLISPDGDVSLLPFEILPDGDRFLIDSYRISYLSSGREGLHFGAAFSHPPERPLVLAEPDYDLGSENGSCVDDAAPVFGSLPYALVEGETVARLLDAEIWTGAEAVASRLGQIRSPRILHLATHGFLLDSLWKQKRIDDPRLDDPLLRSALAFAGVNTWLRGGQPPPQAGNGLLTAAQVAELDLVDTELVVLSACSTGVGTVRAGEGVLGLRRSFALAGARTLVMSLWQVPDRETCELMESFYGYLLAGWPRRDALRQAQLDLKSRLLAQHPDRKDLSPLAWGAFICQGDPGPLLTPARTS